MKKLLLFLIVLFSSVSGFSQEAAGKAATSGKITFEEKIKLEIKLEGDAAQFAESLPKEQVNIKMLLFNQDNTLYTADDSKKPEEAMTQQTGHMTMRMIVSGGNDKTFTDLKKRKKIEQKEFMTRMFLIESEIDNQEWKFTGNNRIVLGYNCQEAVKDDNGKKINAWFTTMIPVSSGPAGFNGLPGLILLVDIDNGKRIITARTIDTDFKDQALLVKPEEGKKVTQEEYKKIVDEKMKEMGTEDGEGGAHVMIRIKG
jgi:GLPGLI family protein